MTSTDLPAGRALDALVAEKVMGWERVELFDHVLNPDWPGPAGTPMYVNSGKATYLVRPGRMQEGDKNIGAREVVGDLVIGGDRDLPRYSTDPAAAWLVAQTLDVMGVTWEHTYDARAICLAALTACGA